MASYVQWFLWALCLLALEMATGTFYLLMLGAALGVGGIAALLGFEPPYQFTFAALAGVVGTMLLRHFKNTRPLASQDQSLDIGQPVQVLSWHEDGTARVHYRGAEWDAEPESADMPHHETLYIEALRGSTLILTHRKPQHS